MNLEHVYVSAVAFLAVFVMLSTLAGLMSLLTRAFPGKPPERKPPKRAGRGSMGGAEPELVAGVIAAVTIAIPGGRVTKIEEVK